MTVQPIAPQSVQHSTVHSTYVLSPAKKFQNMISKSVYNICTIAGVIRDK